MSVFDPSLPLENRKHERFCQLLFEGETQVEAYAQAGYSPDDGHASRLAGNGRIKERLKYLQIQAANRSVVNVESLTADLIKDRDECRKAEGGHTKFKAASDITMAIAKLNGLIVEKSQVQASIGPGNAMDEMSEADKKFLQEYDAFKDVE